MPIHLLLIVAISNNVTAGRKVSVCYMKWIPEFLYPKFRIVQILDFTAEDQGIAGFYWNVPLHSCSHLCLNFLSNTAIQTFPVENIRNEKFHFFLKKHSQGKKSINGNIATNIKERFSLEKQQKTNQKKFSRGKVRLFAIKNIIWRVKCKYRISKNEKRCSSCPSEFII